MKNLKCMHLLLVLVAQYLVCIGNATVTHEVIDERVEGAISEVSSKNIPFSGVVGVVHRGKLIHAKAYGMANVEQSGANVLDTKFLMASISKQFAAAAIMRLVHLGKVDLHAPITKYISGPSSWGKVTTHHLLSHSAGFEMDSPNMEPYDLEKYFTIEEIIDSQRQVENLSYEPGSKGTYCNICFTVAAYIVQQVTGQTYSQFMKEQFYDRLGMISTGQVKRSTEILGLADGYSCTVGSGEYLKGEFGILSNFTGSGSDYSDLSDLLVWVDELVNNRIFPDDLTKLLFKPYIPQDGVEGVDFAYGWRTEKINGRKIVFAEGGWEPGITTNISIWPNDELSTIVISNVTPDPWIGWASHVRDEISEKILP